jgi:hypothetical protein
MINNRLVPCINFIVQQLSSLVVKTALWPRATQANLYMFWSDLDHITLLLSLSPLPIKDINVSLSESWGRLEALEQASLESDISYYLNRIRQVLSYVSYSLDESLESGLELSHQALANISFISQLIENLIEERHDNV